MKYIQPSPTACGAFPPPQSEYTIGLLQFPDEYENEFYRSDKQVSGFVKIEHDGISVTHCEWDEDLYQRFIATMPDIDINETQLYCSNKIKALCANVIITGFDADVLNRGNLHYSLTEIQQSDLKSRYADVQSGVTEVLWHDTSRVTHEIYTAAQFTTLYNAAQSHIISCKIRSDWLEQLAHDLIDADKITEAQAITWETALPEEYQNKCDAQITMLLKPYATV